MACAKQIIETGGGDKYAIKSFTVKDKTINVKKGEFGPYLQIVSGTTKSNIPLPKSYTAEELTLEDVLTIIADKNGTKVGDKNGTKVGDKNGTKVENKNKTAPKSKVKKNKDIDV